MDKKALPHYISISASACVASLTLLACSTTKHLPEGEVLYAGIDKIHTQAAGEVTDAAAVAMSETIEIEPNNSLFGSSRYRWPFPFGLWAYNAFYTEKTSGFRHWLFASMKSDPILISQVNPDLRCRAAEAVLADNGYFGGKVDFELVPNKRNDKMSKVSYSIVYPNPYKLSTIQYMPTPSDEVNNIVANSLSMSKLKSGDVFSATALAEERQRISDLLRNCGYYYFKENNVTYLADSTQSPGKIALRVYLDEGEESSRLLHRSVIDSVFITLDNGQGRESNQWVNDGFMTIGYRGRKLRTKQKVISRAIPVSPGEPYSDKLTRQIKSNFGALNSFKYTQVQYEELDNEEDSINHLRLHLTATYDYPVSGSVEFKAIMKDNHQAGPGMNLKVMRRNCFGTGALLSAELTSTYEWLTGRHASYNSGNQNLLNSYEFGLKTSFRVPRLVLPKWIPSDPDFPATTEYSLSSNIMRRSGFFQMFKATGEIKYDFYTNDVSSHSFSPIRLTYTSLMHTTQKFDSIVSGNKVLQQGFSDQFIPMIAYTYQYDNRSVYKSRFAQQWLQLHLSEAGGLLNAAMGVFSNHPEGERRLLWRKYSQFVKGTIDFRNYFKLDERSEIATRLFAGAVYAYGNATVVPYSEQFYIGGANSLRGFSIRSVGPGTFYPGDNKYGYMDQTGDLKLEGNIEYRFPLMGDLYGALFADAGNIWTIRKEASRPGGQFTGDNFFKQLATDVGLGFRYDIGMLVVRFDIGLPLHDPSELDNSKYYNISGSFFGNLGYHLAIGYPF